MLKYKGGMGMIVNNINTTSPPIVTQPSLGGINPTKRFDDVMGYMALARVTAVHHKYNTVDVQVIKTKEVITSIPSNQGKLGARVCVSNAHYNAKNNTFSGVVEPIQEGQLVILAFLDGTRTQPIILGSLHDTWTMDNNILATKYPLTPRTSEIDYAEALKYLRVFPSQSYFKVDGVGGVEYSHSSTTFLKIDTGAELPESAPMGDSREDFDHDDLSETDPYNGDKTLRGSSEHELLPVHILFTHRSHYEREFSKWLKFYISSEGMFRITRDNNEDNLSYIEIGEDGDVTQRVQLDSYTHGSGDDFLETKSTMQGQWKVTRKCGESLVSVEITPEGDINIIKDEHKSISIDSEEVKLSNNGSFISLRDNGDIEISPKGRLIMPTPNIEQEG